MNPEIIRAVEQRSVLELRYHGYSRMVEPYAYGRTKDGDEILRCFQIKGGSESAEPSGWKLLRVREVFSLYLTTNGFATRPEYKRGDKAMTYIYAQA